MYATRRWSMLIALLVIAALILPGCAQPAPAPPAPEPTKAPAAAAKAPEPTKAPAAPAAAAGEMRKLKGKITVAVQGALPVPGAPETAAQKGWKAALAAYKKYQPDVEIAIEDLPQGQTGEQWCEARKVAKKMPDITYVGECNYFRPTPDEVAKGLNIATDFKKYEAEINPYSGKAWKDDWATDNMRLARCTEAGSYDMWTCQTTGLLASGIWVNWDILKQFGYDHKFPKTYTELWELSDKINKSGKYVAWDGPSYPSYWFAWVMWTNLTTQHWINMGGDPADPQKTNPKVWGVPNGTVAWCKGEFTLSNNPDIQEAAKQWKRFPGAFFGGGAAYYDPARDQTNKQWLTGKAAMDYNLAGMWGAVQQAKTDGTLLVKDWSVAQWPVMTKDDLFNKDLKIWWDGQPWTLFGGFGDVFAPTPNVRASGENANVDLMVRDFFQYMSAEGIGYVNGATGTISLNPKLLDKLDPALKDWLTMQPKIYQGISQPMGSFSNNVVYTADDQKTLQAWAAGQIQTEEAFKRADENATKTTVKRYEDGQKAGGWPDLPKECDPFRTKK